MNTVAIIQARMGSTRLPGKVLRKLRGMSVLGHVIRRVKACLLVRRVMVATTTNAADDLVEQEAAAFGSDVFRGSENDVLSRYYLAAAQANADVIVRVTADCPLLDPNVLCEMLEVFRRTLESPGERLDYLSNTLGQRTFPRGLDAEVFTFDALKRAHGAARDSWDREHVTPYIYGHPESFVLKGFRQTRDHSRYRLTLDTDEDWLLIESIYDAVGVDGELITTKDVLAYLEERPGLAALNAHVSQKDRTSS